MAAETASAGAIKRLVIVESATKAKKIQQYLGPDYVVEASVGHIRDLPGRAADVPAAYKKEPWARLGVNPDNDFEPIYVVDSDKAKKVATLRRELKEVDELLLATDPDREGEAIAWHLLQVLKPKVPARRMVFHEITKPAILDAVENTRELDQDLVDAQETRRILDRLYGYEVSPVLWKKVQRGLSAGRVQSVATRIIVERERERMAFVSADYWDIDATLSGADSGAGADAGGRRTFPARLAQVEGKKVAQGRDFGADGKLTSHDVVKLGESEAKALAGGLEKAEFRVTSVESKPYTRRPAAPFMTSTLQQEAGRKLRFTSSRTMRVAQRLYENGYITYMRTDSTSLSQAGMEAARAQATQLFGSEYVSEAPRRYDRKVKNSQEAHEAIRPAGETFATPGQLRPSLSAEEHLLYELIWKRTLASQMADARGTTVSVRIAAEAAENASGLRETVFNASGRTITFPGFLRVFDDAEEAEDAKGKGKGDGEPTSRLPQLSEGQVLAAEEISPEGHKTNPPARYTEASLVKAMEEMGIGRPSTYASIINTIQNRGYVYSRGNALVPSWLAFPAVRLLEENFATLVDYDFTSLMEDDLDRIAAGQQSRTEWLKAFYFGPEGIAESGDAFAAARAAGSAVGLKDLVGERIAEIDAADVNSIRLFEDSEGRTVIVRIGRYGPYLQRRVVEDGEPKDQRANLPIALNPDELTLEVAEKLFAIPQEGRQLGTDPATGHDVVVKDGPYGPYVAELLPKMSEDELEAARAAAGAEAEQAELAAQEEAGATAAEAKKAAKKVAKKAAKDFSEPRGRMASLFKSMDPETVGLDEALRLLSLPRMVGTDPSDGKEITAQNGRYGPYLKKGTDSRSLGSEEELFTVTLDEARRIYSEPKRRGRSGTPSYLRDLGDDPITSKKILVKDGRFGPYVTDGDTIASLGKGDTPDTLTPERASELLSARRDQQAAVDADPEKAAKKAAKAARKTAKKSGVRKTAAKKTAAQKKAAKKTGVGTGTGARKAAAKTSRTT